MFVRVLGILSLSLLFLYCSYDRRINDANAIGKEPEQEGIEPDANRTTDSPVTAFGLYSNIDGNGEHESGHAVDLWNYNGDLIGVFVGSEGTRLVGDPPTGLLRDVMHNSETGVISFRTRLADSDYEFDGIITENKLTGRLFNIDGRLQSQRCDEAVRIVLVRSKKLTSEMLAFPSFAKWKEHIDELLRFRGAKH